MSVAPGYPVMGGTTDPFGMKGAIMAVARTLFDTLGYDSTTVEQICTRLAIAENDFYRYFPSKEDLLEAIWVCPPLDEQSAPRRGNTLQRQERAPEQNDR